MDPEVELALELIEAGHVAEGVTSLERRLDECPDDVRALFALGEAYTRLERRDDAVACFGRVCTIIPDAVDALDRYAAALGEVGRVDEALAVTAQIGELPGQEATAELRAGLVLARAGRVDDALARLAAAYRLEVGRPRRRTISFEQGRLLAAAGRPAEALPLFARAAADSVEVESEEQAEEMERLRARCAELARQN